MRSDLKILFVTPSYKPADVYGGPTVSVSELAEALVKIGCSVMVYTTTANGNKELNVPVGRETLLNGVRVFYFRRLTKDHTHISPSLWWRLFRTCRKFDVVHFQSWWSILIMGTAIICRLRNTRYIVSPRGMLSRYTFTHQNNQAKKLLHWLLGKRLLRNSILHVTSQLEWDDCMRVHKGWKGFVAANLIHLPEQTKRRHDLVPLVLRLGFLSRIDPKKGLESMFQALSQTRFPYTLFIAGSGEAAYVERLKQLAAALGIAENIVWSGWKAGAEKFAFLREIDVFVLPSFNENFANSVIEALSAGCPVLISDQVGVHDFVRQHSLGWVCEPQVASIHSALIDIDVNRDKISHINAKAPGIVREHFDQLRLAKEYQRHYQAICLQTH